ncbi:MAG: type IV pili methyl-accepting chemotaxis transducer N-terminal domain-containing protein [Planctomycetota bacterium]
MRFVRLEALALVFACLVSGSAAAEPTGEQWARVLNLSGRQRMLTQKMSKEALFITHGVEADRLRGDLAGTTTLFEETLAALRDGDESLGLPATENPRIVKQLDEVQSMYLELKPLFDAVAAGAVLSAEQTRDLASKNPPLLKEMNKAVKMYERSAKKTLTGDAKSAVVINLAGKQRMLTQKMTKECLLVQLDVSASDNLLNLRETTSLFDRTLAGLIGGDEDLELPATTDPETRAQLDRVSALWSEIAPTFQAVLSGDRSLSKEELANLATANVELLKEMNKGVRLFEQAAN